MIDQCQTCGGFVKHRESLHGGVLWLSSGLHLVSVLSTMFEICNSCYGRLIQVIPFYEPTEEEITAGMSDYNELMIRGLSFIQLTSPKTIQCSRTMTGHPDA